MKSQFDFSSLFFMTSPLHDKMVLIFYALLVPGFCLALVLQYFRHPTGSPEVLDSVKRLVIAMLLLVAFPEITSAIVTLSQGIGDLIGDYTGLEKILEMAREATREITKRSSLLLFPNLLISILSYLSYGLLYLAFFFVLALRQFLWALLLILSPILIFFTLFPATANITKNLFRSLLEIASWDVLWRVMASMLKTLGFAQLYSAQDFLTIIILNFVIAMAMFGTPFVTKAIIGSGLASLGSTLQTAAIGAVWSVPAKVAGAYGLSRGIATKTVNITKHVVEKSQPLIARHRARSFIAARTREREIKQKESQ